MHVSTKIIKNKKRRSYKVLYKTQKMENTMYLSYTQKYISGLSSIQFVIKIQSRTLYLSLCSIFVCIGKLHLLKSILHIQGVKNTFLKVQTTDFLNLSIVSSYNFKHFNFLCRCHFTTIFIKTQNVVFRLYLNQG